MMLPHLLLTHVALYEVQNEKKRNAIKNKKEREQETLVHPYNL